MDIGGRDEPGAGFKGSPIAVGVEVKPTRRLSTQYHAASRLKTIGQIQAISSSMIQAFMPDIGYYRCEQIKMIGMEDFKCTMSPSSGVALPDRALPSSRAKQD
jgi:hypothetical protein